MNPVQHSVWMSLAVATAAAVIVLPSTAERPYTQSEPLRERLGQAELRFNLQSELYRREHSRMLAHAAVAQRAADHSSVVFVRSPDVPEGFEQRMRKLTAKGFASLPHRDTTVRVMYVLTLDTGDVVAGTTVQRMRGRTWSADVFPPGSMASDLCVIVARAHDAHTLRPSDPRDRLSGEAWWVEPLGQCWWYAAYGAPGRGVSAWLDSTLYAPIQMHTEYSYNWDLSESAWYTDHDNDWLGRSRARLTIGACSAGRSAACDALLLANIDDNYASANTIATKGWMGVGRGWNVPANRNAATLLRRMQAALGPAEFERLWKSDAPLPETFRSINGGTLTRWIRDQANTAIPSDREQPFPELSSLALLFACIGGLIFLGTRAVARRSGFA